MHGFDRSDVCGLVHGFGDERRGARDEGQETEPPHPLCPVSQEEPPVERQETRNKRREPENNYLGILLALVSRLSTLAPLTLQIVLDMFRFTQQVGNILLRRLSKPRYNLHILLKLLDELFVFLIAPRRTQRGELVPQDGRLILKFAVKLL